MVLGEYQEIEFGARRERMQEVIGGMRGQRGQPMRARAVIYGRVLRVEGKEDIGIILLYMEVAREWQRGWSCMCFSSKLLSGARPSSSTAVQ